MYRVSIVYVSCMYRDYQRNYGCKGSKKNAVVQVSVYLFYHFLCKFLFFSDKKIFKHSTFHIKQ